MSIYIRFVSILFYLLCSLLYYDYNNTNFFAVFLASLSPRAKNSEIFVQNDLIQKSNTNPINGVGQGCKYMVSAGRKIIWLPVI